MGVSGRMFRDPEIQICNELGESGHSAQGMGAGGCEGPPTALTECLEYQRDRNEVLGPNLRTPDKGPRETERRMILEK